MGEVIFHYPSSEFWYNVSFALGCVVFAALAAGLTMGLVSLDVYQLNVLLETSPNSEYTEGERKTLLEVSISLNTFIRPPLLVGLISVYRRRSMPRESCLCSKDTTCCLSPFCW